MKTCLIFVLSFGAFLSYSQGLEEGESWNTIKKNSKGTMICAWNEAYGMMYKANDGQLKGVCIDILNDFVAFAKSKYNTTITLKFIEVKAFDRFLKQVSKTPNVLGVSGVSITDERKRELSFTPHFLTNPNVIITNKDASNLQKLEDLATTYKDYKAKVVAGSIHDVYVKKLKEMYFPGLIIEYTPSSGLIFEEMLKNKNMFTIVDLSEYLGAYRNKMELVRQNVKLGFVDKLAFVMPKNSDWGIIWNEFLTEDYRRSSNYRKIISENLGSSYLEMTKQAQ